MPVYYGTSPEVQETSQFTFDVFVTLDMITQAQMHWKLKNSDELRY